MSEHSPVSTETPAEVPAQIRDAAPNGPGFSRSTLVAAGLGIALLVGAAVAGIVLNGKATGASAPPGGAQTGPVLLVPVNAPQAGSAGCANLVKNLPSVLPNAGSRLARRPLASPAPPSAAAWGPGTNPVVLRCGVEQPPELTPTSELLQVSGVQWLRISADGATTWYAVDRAACVALTLPAGPGTGPIQEVSATISATMPAVPIHPNGG